MIQKLMLKNKNIYVYLDADGKEKLCAYLCDTDKDNEIIVGVIDEVDVLNNQYIRLENGLKKVLYLDKYLRINPKNIVRQLYVGGKAMALTDMEYHHLSISIFELILLSYERQVEKNVRDMQNNQQTFRMIEDIFKLLTWNVRKFDLKFNTKNDNLVIMEKCIYFAYMGTNIGGEINKLRPVLVWRKHESRIDPKQSAYYAFPLSSKINKKKYSHDVYLDIGGVQCKIMINQGRLLSKSRFVKIFEDKITKKVFSISEEQELEIIKAIKFYFGV